MISTPPVTLHAVVVAQKSRFVHAIGTPAPEQLYDQHLIDERRIAGRPAFAVMVGEIEVEGGITGSQECQRVGVGQLRVGFADGHPGLVVVHTREEVTAEGAVGLQLGGVEKRVRAVEGGQAYVLAGAFAFEEAMVARRRADGARQARTVLFELGHGEAVLAGFIVEDQLPATAEFGDRFSGRSEKRKPCPAAARNRIRFSSCACSCGNSPSRSRRAAGNESPRRTRESGKERNRRRS